MHQALALAATALLLLGGCAIKPLQFVSTPAQQCTRLAYPVRIDVGEAAAPATRSAVPDDPLLGAVARAYRTGPSAIGPAAALRPGGGISPSMLVLSGGGEKGAFSAGVLSAWAEDRPDGLPQFRVVTGVSTGAIQAPFAFLGDAAPIADHYRIRHEREVLRPFTSSGLAGGGLAAAFTVARKGAVGSLQPLRDQLHSHLTAGILERIAREAERGRLLLVAAVEMDSGDAYAFDLTRIAQSFAASHDEAMRDCFIEAIMASASVPGAALPVFIDGRMYVDGGARFGVIAAKFDTVLATASAADRSGRAKHLFVVMNGALQVAELCGLADCATAPPPRVDAQGNRIPPKWRITDVGFRAIAILIDQVYRASAYWTSAEANHAGFETHSLRIDSGAMAGHEAQVGLPPDADARKRCDEWRRIDQRIDAPVEFHPRFMRCLLDYGRAAVRAAGWTRIE